MTHAGEEILQLGLRVSNFGSVVPKVGVEELCVGIKDISLILQVSHIYIFI